MRLLLAPDRSTAAGRLSLGIPKQTGTVIEVRSDTLVFAADKQSARTLIPAASVMGIEVSRGIHSHVLRGAGLGFLAGALVGGVIGASSLRPNDEYRGLVTVFGAAVGGGSGIVLGAIIGSTRTERWEALRRLPIDIGILPCTDDIGLSVEGTLR